MTFWYSLLYQFYGPRRYLYDLFIFMVREGFKQRKFVKAGLTGKHIQCPGNDPGIIRLACCETLLDWGWFESDEGVDHRVPGGIFWTI